MAVTATETNGDICTAALRKIGVIAMDTPPTADEMAVALAALGRMLKSWQNRGLDRWLQATMEITPTSGSVFTLDPVRPLEIRSVRLVKSGRETRMEELTRDRYDNLPNKAQTGRPNSWFYNRQREAARLHVYPAFAAVTDELLRITYTREIEDVAQSEPADIPGEWYDAAVYGLAARLADDFAINAPNVVVRAEMEFDNAMAADREGSVTFLPYGYDYDGYW